MLIREALELTAKSCVVLLQRTVLPLEVFDFIEELRVKCRKLGGETHACGGGGSGGGGRRR